MNDKIEIPLSKNKLLIGTIGSLIFVVLSIWLFFDAAIFQENSLHFILNPTTVKGIGILGVLFFGATGIYGFRKLFDKKIGLTVDEKGITDNTHATSVGLIAWDDITEIVAQQIMSTQFLLIKVKNPEQYIRKAGSRKKGVLLRLNMKMNGTPLSITATTLKYEFEKIEEIIRTEFEKYKGLGKG